jgi:PAS domain S-box-containing protein
MLLAQYKDAIEASNIVSKTDIYGIITFVNDEFCKISGYTKEELIGENHNIVRHPDVPTKNFKVLWNTISRKKTYTSTVQNLAKDGSVFYVNTTITPILDENNEIIEYIAIRYDVTQQMELKFKLEAKEIELELANKKLKEKVKLKTQEIKDLGVIFHQARLASMGEMIANIAHQWRQPLTSLNILLFNMRKESLKSNIEEVDNIYKLSKKTIKNMSDTLEDFTDFFRPDKQKKIFNIQSCIDESISLLGKTILNENISVKTNIEDASIVGISNELTQVFINLIQNSKDAFVSNNIINRIIMITVKYNQNRISIEFQDNAGGIDNNIIENIFEPYFTTKHQYQGTGLGLFMSNMICEQSFSGSMSVSSCDDKTIFKIQLPIEK